MGLSRVAWLMSALPLMGCMTTEPVVQTATPNLIAISYDAYGTTPTLLPQAIDLAIQHCRSQGGLYANYRGATSPNPLTAQEVHTFVCEATKTDDNAVIAAQNAEATAMAVAAAGMVAATTYRPPSPVMTQCNTIGYQTICTSY